MDAERTDVGMLFQHLGPQHLILGIPAQHHEETCRLARQVYSRYGTAQEASVDGHGTFGPILTPLPMSHISGPLKYVTSRTPPIFSSTCIHT